MTDTKKPDPDLSTLATIQAWLTQTKGEITVIALAAIGAACFILAPDTRWTALGHFLQSVIDHPTTAIGAASTLGAIAGAFVLAYRRVPAPTTKGRGRVGGGAALLFALALGGSLVSGCTPSQWSDAMHVIKPAGKFACDVARMLCVKGGDDVACAAVGAACSIVDALPIESVPTSGGESDEPHDLDIDDSPVSSIEPLRHHTPLACQVLDRRPLRDHARVRT